MSGNVKYFVNIASDYAIALAMAAHDLRDSENRKHLLDIAVITGENDSQGA